MKNKQLAICLVDSGSMTFHLQENVTTPKVPCHTEDPIKISLGYRVSNLMSLSHSLPFQMISNCLSGWQQSRTTEEWKIPLLLFGISYCGHQSRLRDGERDSAVIFLILIFFFFTHARCTIADDTAAEVCRRWIIMQGEPARWRLELAHIYPSHFNGIRIRISGGRVWYRAAWGGGVYANEVFRHGVDDNTRLFIGLGAFCSFSFFSRF